MALALLTVFGLLGLFYFISNRAKTKTSLASLGIRSIWPSKLRTVASLSDAASLQLLRRVSLTGSHQLHLIRAAEETFLVCTHAQGCTLLWASDLARDSNLAGATAEGLKRYAS